MGWLTKERFLEWLLQIDIFELFFGESSHPELTKKYLPILSFVYQMNALTEKNFDMIWEQAMKHDSFRANILKVLTELAY